jgi:hypothetical protein
MVFSAVYYFDSSIIFPHHQTLTVEITSRNEQVVNQVTSHMKANGFNSAGLIMGQGYYDRL